MIDRQLAYCRRVIVRSLKVKVCKNQLLVVVNMIRDTYQPDNVVPSTWI